MRSPLAEILQQAVLIVLALTIVLTLAARKREILQEIDVRSAFTQGGR